jgi:hypothetical protein
VETVARATVSAHRRVSAGCQRAQLEAGERADVRHRHLERPVRPERRRRPGLLQAEVADERGLVQQVTGGAERAVDQERADLPVAQRDPEPAVLRVVRGEDRAGEHHELAVEVRGVGQQVVLEPHHSSAPWLKSDACGAAFV